MFKQHSFCRLQTLSIWSCLKIYQLAKFKNGQSHCRLPVKLPGPKTKLYYIRPCDGHTADNITIFVSSKMATNKLLFVFLFVWYKVRVGELKKIYITISIIL